MITNVLSLRKHETESNSSSARMREFMGIRLRMTPSPWENLYWYSSPLPQCAQTLTLLSQDTAIGHVAEAVAVGSNRPALLDRKISLVP